MAKPRTIQEVAAEFGVSRRAVRDWREQGLGAANEGHRPLLFDIQDVRKWLAAHGITPGARGREGGKARQAGGRAGSPHRDVRPARPPPVPGGQPPGEAGLDGAVERLRQFELTASGRLQAGITDGTDEQGLQGLIRTWELIFDQLRKAEGDLQDLKLKQGVLIARADFADSMRHIAAVFRSYAERLPGEIGPAAVTALGSAGVQVSDIGIMQGVLHDEVQRIVDGWLKTLSDEVRKAGGDGSPAG